ncbi:MAG: shikimate kinase [Gammaproteobacteria bacterium]
MGTGKTTIGSQLARSLRYQFIDADQELEKRTGASIALIFDVEGESGFREREARLIDELTQRDETVLATGGGAILDANSRRRLEQRGFVVYLKSDVETLVERTRFDNSRPLLKTADPAQTLRELMVVREPLYASIADLTIDTGRQSVKQVVKKITTELA